MSEHKCMKCAHGSVCGDFEGSHSKNCEYFLPESEWISVKDRLPEPETEVIILAQRNTYQIITTAMYEDGKTGTEDSVWNWQDVEFKYDEENDLYIIPEGWWEHRHYNPDDVYNNCVDDVVTHWQPLPQPPKGDGE